MSERKRRTPIEERPLTKKELITQIVKKIPRQKFLSENQKTYYNTLFENEITICTGPAGVGKSYVSMRAAIDLLIDHETPYEKIVLIRPAVEGGESKLGFLPGGFEEKMDPYIFPSYYLMDKIITKENRLKLKEMDFIEINTISFLRGTNIDNSILILEEAQNATPAEMKLILTRIGFNSKFFISGDIEQSDKFRNREKSGLYDALIKFNDIDGIGTFSFSDSDIVRNPLISKILKKYED
jgi:phosphate starvation-inducible PhoH-like protein